MAFDRRNIRLTEGLKKEISGAKNIFEIFCSFSTSTPPGAYPLWTGEWIRECASLFPEFYQYALQYRDSGAIRVVNNATYENEISTYGQTGAFVIEGNDIRLPKITKYLSGYTSTLDIGVPLPAGLPNIEGRVGGLMYWADRFTNSERVNRQGHSYGTTEYANGAFKKTLSYRGGADGGSGSGFCHGYMDASWSNPIYGASDTVQPPAVQVALYIQVFNRVAMEGFVNVSDVINVIRDYTNRMDQKYQEAIDAMNRVIGSGALGMPDYERYTLLLNNTYRSSYEYTVQKDGWFYARWRNNNVDPTRITTVHVYSDTSKVRELTTVTTSDGRRAGEDAGTTDQTILVPVRAGYHIVANNLNYAYFYPTFGQ